MNKASPPLCKGGPDMPETFIIPDHPYVPPGSKHHFSKKRLIKGLLGAHGNLNHVRTLAPINLQICPNSNTEVALEKEMISSLQVLCMAEHTLRAILNVPVSSDEHVLCIEAIHNNHPRKNLVFKMQQDFQIQFKRGLACIGSCTIL